MSVVCPRVPPAPYIKERQPLGGAKEGKSPPPSRSRTPPFLVQLGRGRGKEEGERKERGAPPPSLSNSD